MVQRGHAGINRQKAAITPVQCRAARMLADMTQTDLAAESGLSTGTIKAFERGHRSVTIRTMRDIVAALQSHGVSFSRANIEGKATDTVTLARQRLY